MFYRFFTAVSILGFLSIGTLLAQNSDIIITGAFSLPTNIPYATAANQNTLIDDTNGTDIARFTVRDGGASAPDADTNPTTLSTITIDFGPNWAMLREAELRNFDSSSPLAAGDEKLVNAQTVQWTGLSDFALDNQTLIFTVKVTFNDPVTDNSTFPIKISAATATGTAFAAADAGGATTTLTGDQNKIEVTATKLAFVTGPSNVVVTQAMTPAVTIESIDALDNRDLDNTSSVAVTSTGTLTGTPVTVSASSGLATFSTLTHTVVQGGRSISATAAGLTATGASSTFNVTVGTSDITLDGGFTHPSNIPYDTHQEASDIVNSTTSLVVGQFILRDGGGVNDPDALPTVLTNLTLNLGANFAVIRRIALFDAAGTTQLTGTSEVVGGATAVFSGLSLSTVTDFGTTTFTVRASFADPITDNLQFSMTVSSATAQAGNSQFATAAAGGAVSSTTLDENRIEVLATKLIFQTGPSNVFTNTNMAPAVVVHAVDALDNRDLDNGSTIAITSTGTLTGTPVTVVAGSGQSTFSTLQHSVAGTALTLSATATVPALTASGPSSTFLVSAGSDIILNSGFTSPSNIPYASHQAADIVNSGTSINVARFDIRDGGGVPDPLTNTTVMTDLTLDMGPNFAMFRRVALFDAVGTAQLAGTSEVAGGTQLVAFSGLSIAAPDDGSIAFTVRVSFMNTSANITDNQQFSVAINTATATGSPFAPGMGGAITPTTVDLNRIEVTATRLLFVAGPTNVDANVSMTPVTIEAVDAVGFANRDLDNISNVAITSTGTLTGAPVTVAAVNGLATFSTLTHTVVQAGRTLSATSTAPVLTPVGPSATFNVTGTSDIILDGGFTHPSNIPYDTHQEAIDIVNSTTSLVVGRFILRDGSGVNDPDALPTVLTNLTLNLGANFAVIRRIALFDAAGTTQLTGTSEVVGGATAVFSGLSLSTAIDFGTTTFSVRASFTDPITDNLQFSMTVTSATAQAGNSQFATAAAGGAVSSTTLDENRIEVLATKLIFQTGPSNVFTNTNMAPAIVVHAVDVLDNRDLDNTSSIAITSTGTLTGTPVTVVAGSGQSTFSTLQHSVAGTALTLSAAATAPALTASGPSSTFFISGGSDIIANTTFTYINDIPYTSHQDNSNIQNDGNSLRVAQFDIRDGGGTTDPDGTGTNMTGLTLDLGPNWANIQLIALYNAAGTTEVATSGTNDQLVTAQTVVFSGLSGTPVSAGDGLTTTFSIRVSFQPNVTDNQQFSFTVTGTTTAAGSSFATAAAGGAVSSIAGDNNRIEVTATKLSFVQQPPGTVFNGVAMSPAITVEAADALDNRDLDNASSVIMASNGLPAAQGTVVAINGLATFPAIIHTTSANNKEISATSTGPVLTATGNSSTFDIVAPGSDIRATPAFVYPTNIPYDTHQAGNIVNSVTSLVVAKFDVRDGSGTSDGDALATTMTNLTLDLGPNFGLIRRIALYDGTGATELTGTNEQVVSTQTVSFSGLSVIAPDNSSITFAVRVSFQDPVTDNQQFFLTVTAATATGSPFSSGSAGGATTSIAGDNNRIEVLATKLLFFAQPVNSYVNVAMATMSVESVDVLDNRDLDNTSTIAVTSTGSLTGTPVTLVGAAGLASFTTLTHTVVAAGRELSATATLPSLTGTGLSNTFDILPPTNASDIVLNGGFTHPSNIAYNTFQEAANIVNSATSLVVTKFDIRDGGGAIDGDPFPTVMTGITLDLGPNFNLIRRIALYDAAGTVELTGTNEQAVGTQLVSFSGLSVSAADNGPTTFSVRVSFSNPVTDNQQFSFTVTSTATQGINSGFAAINAGGAVSSTAVDNNRIEVFATKLLFVQGPTGTFASLFMQPDVTVEAVDPLNNRDLDNTSNVSITSTGTLTGTPVVVGALSGLATFPTLTHTGSGTGFTLSATSTAPVLTTTGPSNTFSISDGSDIAAGPVLNSNIPYQLHQEAFNIINSPTSLVVAEFVLRDGGVAPIDPDVLSTILTDLTLDLGLNFGLINKIALYNAAGTVELPAAVNEQFVVGQFVNFVGLNIVAADNSSTPFTVRVSFSNVVTDNLQFSFLVTSATASGAGSFFPATDAGGAITSTAGDNNRIEVTADRVRFNQGPSNAFINVAMAPAVTIESTDILNNRDLDNTSTISITSTGTLTGSPVVVVATAGLASFPALSHSVAQVSRTISATASGPVLATTGASVFFNILPPSSTSNIIANGPFPYPSNIAYNTFQENANIVNSATSLNVGRFDIQDGGGADADNFPTVLTNLTLDLGPNFGVIRRIALYDAAGTAELPGTNEQAVSTQLVSFTGLSITAPDNGAISFTVRVSFQDPITDNLQFSFTVNNTATLAINSSFAVPSAGGASSSVAADNNRIEVFATKLLYVQGPTNAFINVAMSPAVTVEAVDPLDNRDLDNASNVSITSTGTLTGSPVVIAAINGLATFPGLAHSVAQTLRTISATSTAPVLTATGISSTFAILTPIATSNIILNAGFTHPTNIPYQNFQEAGDIVNSTTSLVVARFDIQDGGGVSDADAFPTVLTNLTLDLGTNFGLINRIALYDAAGTAELAGTNEQAVSTQLVSFSGLSVSAPDNGSISFSVRVSFKNTVTDNLQFSVLINNTATVPTNSAFAAANAGGAITSVAGDNNRIEVTATLLRFTTNLIPTILPAKNISIQQAVPVARAEDALVNVDLDYSSNATIGCVLPINSITIVPVAGVFTFAPTFQYLQTGNGTITLSAPTLTSAISNAVNVQEGTATTITLGAIAPATISSLVNPPGAPLAVFNFDINDDLGAVATNNDGLPTLISQIIITRNSANDDFTDWSQALADAELTDGSTTIPATAISATSITFGGIPSGINTQLGHVVDNATKTYTLRIRLRTSLLGALPTTIDGMQFEFQVLAADITLASNSTKIIPLETATSGNRNVVAVVATSLRFLSPAPPGAFFASLNTDFPGISVEAKDANNNRDLGFTGAAGIVQELSNPATSSMSTPPTVSATQFTAGLLNFPANFRFTSGANGANVTLTLKAGPGVGTTCGVAGIICGTSGTITLQSASESRVKGDPAFSFQTNIAQPVAPFSSYVLYQASNIQPADIVSNTGSYEISRILLSDGDADFIAGDFDGASTILNSITIRIADALNNSTMGHIRNIALYNSGFVGATEIQELPVTPGDVAAGQITFSGLSIVAADDNTTTISIRVSFNNTPAAIIDKTLLRVSIANAIVGSGSQLRSGSGEIAGVPAPGLQAPLAVNLMNVVATKLDFVTQPAPFAGKQEPVTAGIVHARDQFNVLDTDFNLLPSGGIVSSQGAANVLGSFGFTNGVLNMAGLITYGNPGLGTLTVNAAGLSSLTNLPLATPPNVAIPCTRVDVIHVGTIRQDGGPGGVPPGDVNDEVSVLAGTSDQVMLGFRFNAPYGVSGPNHPQVTRFTITSNTSVSGVLNNIRIFESTTGQFSVATQVPIGNVSFPNSQSVTVDFTATPKDLTLLPNLTYFLMADIDVNVGGSTTPITLSIKDLGVGSLEQNNILVLGNIGSQNSNTSGPKFNFASVAPPTLVSTYPRVGQTNVDPTQPKIEMTFSVPVFTLDQAAKLYRKSIPPAADVLVATLSAIDGFPFVANGIGAKPISFAILPGTMVADAEYYVTVASGNLSTNTGIADASRNLFQGITYPGTFFFRTASPIAPNLLGSTTTPAASAGDPIATDVTNGSATINATFDQLGKAYYIVCSTNNPTAPTSAQIVSEATGTPSYFANTVIGKGLFDINATHTISQFGAFGVPGGFAAGPHYVWITAESVLEKKVGAVITTTPTLAPAPYGSSSFNFATIGGPVTGPTFNFPAPGPSPSPLVTTNNVTIGLCSNSFQILNTPIIIYEGTNPGQQFNSPTPDQGFNLVLPGGFQFDESSGAVDLIGSDFLVGSGTLTYLSSSVLKITFTNTGTLSKDQIIIRNLRVKSDGSRAGNIFRLGGLAIPAINDGTTLARLSAQESAPITFDNSYSESLGESWATTSFSETAIPNNANPDKVTLIPYITNSFDFGPTTFAGQGVSINELNVKGVTLDFPFNITVTHTDQNGCISDSPVQFVVYDNARAIVITNPAIPANVPPTVPFNLDQGPYCSEIPTFKIGEQLPSPAAPGVLRDVTFDNLDAYYMESLSADIPATIPPLTIISGPFWRAIVQTLPQTFGAPVSISGYFFQSYKFDDKKIVNASAIAGPLNIQYVYDNFDNTRPISPNYPSGIIYYDGGSLGFVEFTGTFRNIANPVVKINRRQIVEFTLPAVPAIEFVTPASFLITTDPQNTPSLAPNLNNPGTFVFCEAGGLITVNGWPKADPLKGETGVFRIYNAATLGTQIMTGLVNNNGTGTVQINPTDNGIKNSNNNIRIEYEFTDARGVCSAIGSQVFRISPNPIAMFTMTSLASPFVDATNPLAYCETKPIRFDPSASSVSGGGATIETYTWIFDDATNSISSNPNFVSGLAGGLAVPGSPGPPIVPPVPAAGTNDLPVHYYKDFNTYNPRLVITSNRKCQSNPRIIPVTVGGIPEVKVILDGTHAGPAVADAFHFRSNNSVISSNDNFKALDWTYGDGAFQTFTAPPVGPGNDPLFNTTVFAHNYSITGPLEYDLRVTTALGCINSLSLTNTLINGISIAEDKILRTLIVLPRFIVTASNAYLETFEPAANDPAKIWQAYYTGAFTTTPIPPALTPIRSVDPSWQVGIPTKFLPTVNGTNIWTTSLSGTYQSGERSAIYSPSFDLSSLLRPMISFDTYTQLEAADGVVLQYSIDNKNIADPTKAWLVLGTETDGELWYTDRGIAAKPGDQIGNDYGWSQNTNDQWLSSRHALVDAGTSVIITDPRVVFRLALGSAATSIDEEGFGFDNVRIGERTRTILLENFTNSANTTKSSTTPVPFTTDEEYESSIINGFSAALVGLEVVKLNYHVNFPGNDPFNKGNPADPSSRALFYNVAKTPSARLDGYSPNPYTPFSDWGQNSFNTRTLRLAQATIVIRPATPPDANITSSGTITFFVDIIPTVNLDPKTILHVGIVEQLIPIGSLISADQDLIKTGETSFEYVAKKLLPSASGTRTSTHPGAVGGVLVAPPFPAPPVTYTFGPFEWSPDLNRFYSPSTGDLGVIAFLQREDGDKEVYQAEIVLSLDDPPSSLITGLEALRAEDVKVYPNPANQDMTVLLPAGLAKAANVQLIDQTGRTALRTTIPLGSDRKTLNVSELSSGMYILTLDTGSGVLTRKKVMVVHQD